MRIFLVYHPSGNLSVPNSLTWYKNLYAPLIDLGHEVFAFRLDEFVSNHQLVFRSTKYKELLCEQLVQIFKREHHKKPFDIFLSYLTVSDISPNTIDEIRKIGVLTLNFSCNNTHQFHLVESIANHFDINLFSEKGAKEKFTAIRANAVWFQMAANPKYYFPKKNKFRYDISFIGAAYAKRANYINHLVQHKIYVDCFGPNWLINQPYASLKKIKKELARLKWIINSLYSLSLENRSKLSLKISQYDILSNLRKMNYTHLHYPVSDDAMIDIIGYSKINLGFLEVYSEEGHAMIQQHLHLREFEIPMCGGLYLTNYSDELAEFYEIDKEVVVFRNENELIDKVKYYLSHENEANSIREAAYNRSIKCHTYQQRFSQLFQQIKK